MLSLHAATTQAAIIHGTLVGLAVYIACILCQAGD